MKKLIILLFAVVIIMAGCSQNTEVEIIPETDESLDSQNAEAVVEGELEEGQRIINLVPGYSSEEITVYRGNTVKFTFSAEGQILLSLPEFEEKAEGENSVSVTVKAKETGEYAISSNVGDNSETGKFKVIEYKKEGSYYNVGPAEFEAQMNGSYVLLDVRTQQEYDSGAIEGATLIPLNELSGRVGEISGCEKVLVYCRSGNRSVAASEILLEAGFASVYDLEGGIGAWQAFKNE